MGTEYNEVSFDISPKQRKSLASAFNSDSSAKLKLTNVQLFGNNSTILATNSQIARIEKAKDLGKGILLSLSKKQMEKMKKHQDGGFLPVVLGALVSSLAPVLFSKLFPGKQEGEGIELPNGRGLDIEPKQRQKGNGFIQPDNGGNTQYRINNFSAQNAGNGIVMPGKTSGSVSAKKYVSQAATGVKKKQVGMSVGYIHPTSETAYQYLE
jgi:hypothetical protein